MAAILWVVCLAVFADSFRMTFDITLPGVDAKAWLVAPGLIPLFLSGGLLLMLSAVMAVALRAGALRALTSGGSPLALLRNEETFKGILQVALLCVFVFVLLGRVHFGLASALYLFCAMYVAAAGHLLTIGAIALVTSAAITVVFGELMNIPLP